MSAHLLETGLGAKVLGKETLFGAFSSSGVHLEVVRYLDSSTPDTRHPMAAIGHGFYSLTLPVGAGALYKLAIDGTDYPDPFARSLPYGVHGPAQVCASDYSWTHTLPGLPLEKTVLYELHVGTFTPEGTYRSAEARLPYLAQLGVTAVELMPVAAFAGRRGWGYDGVALFAPYCEYGTPDELRHFVDAAHGLGLGVILDVVYNHLGPAGNYLPAFYPGYFTRDTATGWGEAPDFSQPLVRRIVNENAHYWLNDFRFDGLRLDAVHAIVDRSDQHIVREISDMAHSLAPPRLIFAEDERNSVTLYREGRVDAIWADDFHHQLRTTLTGESDGYYAAYSPSADAIARALVRGWLFEGELYLPSGKPRGTRAEGMPPQAFVYCLENHDQIGNRALGTRLDQDVSLDAFAAASTLLLYWPTTPLLFMGQEWAASSPFQFFTDHDAELGKAVVEGRRSEFKSFRAFSDPEARLAIPDPQADSTFDCSHLNWDERQQPRHARIDTLYRRLLALRKSDPVLRDTTSGSKRAWALDNLLVCERTGAASDGKRVLIVNLGKVDIAWPPALAAIFTNPGSLLLTSGAMPAGGQIPAETALLFIHPTPSH